MNKKIKFSIIIPNYNKGQYIEECLNSVFNQTYKDYEVIVIDDGSTDNSVDIIKKFDVQLLNTNRMQAGGARNLGLKHCKGDYVIFIDSDDYLTCNTVLEKLSMLIKDEDLIFLNYTKDDFGKVELVNEPKEDIALKIEKTKSLGCPTKCFKRELLDGVSFAERKKYEDIAFTLEAMCKTKSYTYFEESFFTYRKVVNSNVTSTITGDVMLDIIEELLKIYRFCFKYPQYKLNLLKRIKKDKLALRLNILEDYIEFDKNTFYDYFN